MIEKRYVVYAIKCNRKSHISVQSEPKQFENQKDAEDFINAHPPAIVGQLILVDYHSEESFEGKIILCEK